MHKQDDVRAAVIARLWEIAGGARPKRSDCGLCAEIHESVGSGEPHHLICNTIDNLWTPSDDEESTVSSPLGPNNCFRSIGQFSGWRGNERRTLAGFLAAWLEDEQP